MSRNNREPGYRLERREPRGCNSRGSIGAARFSPLNPHSAIRNPKKQQGLAIVLALLVVALATTAASYMVWQQQLLIRQSENLTALAQGQAVARAALDWGRLILAEDGGQGNKVDHLGEDWARSLEPTPVEGGQFVGKISDAQGRYNLNSLTDRDTDGVVFRRLLTVLELPSDLANAVRDWIDADDQVSFPGGAEDLDYLGGNDPYRAANRLLIDINALYRIKGFTPEIVKRLRPFVTALPRGTPVNVNTATAEVLTALFEDLGLDAAKDLVEKREKDAFDDLNAFKERTKTLKLLNPNMIDVKSDFFLLNAAVQFSRTELSYLALVQRQPAGRPKLLWQRQQ